MKKLLSLLLVLTLITASFAGCGAKDDPTADNQIQQETETNTETENTEEQGNGAEADAPQGEDTGAADADGQTPDKPSESNTDKPAESKPADKPAETKPADKPAETKPAEPLPPDTNKLPDTEAELPKPGDAEVSLGNRIKEIFDKSGETDPSKMADEIINGCADLTQISLVKEIIEAGGWMPGFDSEISGYTEAAMFAPMIGSIPFVGYVCKSDDPAALEKAMKDNANLSWNICVTADEMVSSVRGNLVFFLMCPSK